jgi:hypothetical protein
MIIEPLSITYDVDWALDYYNSLESDWQHMKVTMPPDFYYETLRNAYGWSLQVPSSWDPAVPFPRTEGWDIVGRENFINTELVYGFAKKVLDVFDTNFRTSISVCIPGTHFLPHVDGNSDILVRGWMPITTNDSFKWITDEGSVVLKPGVAYMIDIAHTHEVINAGNTNGASLVFDIPREEMERFRNINMHLAP